MENYLSRLAYAFILALVLCLSFMPIFIKWAKHKATQPIYEDAPKSHALKAKTPTMGGVIMVLCAVISASIFAHFSPSFISALIVLIGFCALGMIDDYNKIKNASNHAGLSAKAKMLGCILISLLAVGLSYHYGTSTKLWLPGFKIILFDMGIFALGFWVLVMISCANSVNLTDGLDALAGSCAFMSIAFMSALAILGADLFTASKFNLVFSPKSAEIYILSAALLGSLIGFLWYNAHPAQVFMGDSGSLALGAFLGFIAIESKNELLLIIMGIIFVCETLSVIIQIACFKLFKRRVFKMSPLHHHFEQLGYAETKVCMRFQIVAFLAGAIGFIIQIIS